MNFNATRDDALRSLRELDLFVKIRRLDRRDQLKVRNLIDQMLTEPDTARKRSLEIVTRRSEQGVLDADVNAARTWALNAGRDARVLPGGDGGRGSKARR